MIGTGEREQDCIDSRIDQLQTSDLPILLQSSTDGQNQDQYCSGSKEETRKQAEQDEGTNDRFDPWQRVSEPHDEPFRKRRGVKGLTQHRCEVLWPAENTHHTVSQNIDTKSDRNSR